MNENDKRWQIAVLWSVALLGAACSPANKQVGSACANGVCPAALAKDHTVCSASEVSFVFSTSSPSVMCLPRPLPKDDLGQVRCQVLWRQNRPWIGHACSDPFLSPGPDDSTCLVNQVSASSLDASMSDGWYYDENYHDCPNPPLAIRFTLGALPPDVNVTIHCDTVRTSADAEEDAGVSPSDESECVLPKDSARHSSSVGDRCEPQLVPEGAGFHEHEAWVETGSGQCGTGACLVYHVKGNPRPDCTAPSYCADPAEAEDRVYCSCRCASPKNGPKVDSSELCKCGDGFTCDEETISNGPEGLRGGYCIRIPSKSTSSISVPQSN